MVEENKDIRFGRYELHRTLGRGGFGVVYLARDIKLDRDVALKVLRTGVSGEALHRFIREAKILTNLRHPNIVTVLDAQIDEKAAYIAMEHIQASSLTAVMVHRKLALKETLSITVQIGEAIHYLHERDILHRDIKPENILLTEEGRALLIDFNLGLDMDLTALTRTGCIIGTPRYMAPELWKGQSFCKESDVYGLGLVLHNMLTNDLGSFESIMGPQDVAIRPEAPSKLEPTLGTAYDEFMAWVLAPNPQKRPSMKEFLSRLPRLGSEDGSGVVSEGACGDGVSNRVGASFLTTRFFAPVIFCLLLALCLYSFISSSKREPTEIEIFLLADTFLATIPKRSHEPPRWKVLCRGKAIAKGNCQEREGHWAAEVEGLSERGPLELQFWSGSNCIGQNQFNLPPKNFAEAPRLRVGGRTIELSWRLHGVQRLRMVATFLGAQKEQIKKEGSGNNAIKMNIPPNSKEIRFELYWGKHCLTKGNSQLGPVNRLDGQTFPKGKLPLRGPSLIQGNTVVLGHLATMSALGVNHSQQGPTVLKRWMTTFDDNHVIIDMAADGPHIVTLSRLRLGDEQYSFASLVQTRTSTEDSFEPKILWTTPLVGRCENNGLTVISVPTRGVALCTTITKDGGASFSRLS